jgi:peroxiredoxin
LGDLKAGGYQLVAISPDTVESMKKGLGQQRPDGYVLLSDPGIEAIAGFGLAFRLDAKTVKGLQDFGVKLPPVRGMEGSFLPVPAVYLVDKQGAITFAHYDPDYKSRLAPQAVLKAAQ